MNGTLDDVYLTWLTSQVSTVKARTSSRTYTELLHQLYTKEFVWFIPNDDNRVEDGRELRYDWMNETGSDPDEDWMRLSCSFLELLIGLARRLSFEAGGEPPTWFWHLLQNLGLDGLNDRSNYAHTEVDERLDMVIWRTYARDGQGGLFPLRRATRDQRNVEIWYQLSAYLNQGE